MAVVDSTASHQELRKVLAPRYVPLAFDLPEGSGSIWSIVADDMASEALDDDANLSPEKLLAFLAIFFAEQVIQVVANNLDALNHSYLGIGYTLGRGKAAIGKSVLESAREEAAELNTPLAGFLGQVSEIDEEVDTEADPNDEGWHQMGRPGRNNKFGGGLNRFEAGPSEQGFPGVPNDGKGAGDNDGGAGNDGGPQHFLSMEENMVLVHLPPYPDGKSPPRDNNRKITVKQRSGIFQEAMQIHGSLYDPHSTRRSIVSLYHGTRTSSLPSFCLTGIEPTGESGEFCRASAFYTSNSARHAFERPLNYKIGRAAEDVISVLEFRVDTGILHGDKVAPGEPSKFKVHWFSSPSDEWKRFCIANMATDPKLRALAPRHSFDIVIGPVCQPRNGGTDMRVIGDRVRGDVYLCQVAFCTPRTWSWLETCFKRVFQERRDATNANV